MIPAIYRTLHLNRSGVGQTEDKPQALSTARRETAAVIGIAAAIGALGGYFIPRAFGASISATGGAGRAVMFFVAFYLACVGTTWWCYLRRSLLAERNPEPRQRRSLTTRWINPRHGCADSYPRLL